jgi:hypothetical protein
MRNLLRAFLPWLSVPLEEHGAIRGVTERRPPHHLSFSGAGRHGGPSSELAAARADAKTAPQKQEGSTGQYTLQAVFDWYQALLAAQLIEAPSEPARAVPDSERAQSRPGDYPRSGVPGFPGFTRQILSRENGRICVRFFDAKDKDAGGLVLRRERRAWLIEVPTGQVFRVREAATASGMK